ncbi:MAG: hypothetical protein OXI13_00785 [Gammaproteobacteria bacterium]|nr:hypothetical protein [Gammaproteobacteria bacterium]MDE0478144.1 hypothetical protein [Gammaproteobacteria bacterium]
MFGWLETTVVANWVALSLWAYPALLSLHIVGLAIVVGIFVTRDLRLAGFVRGIDPRMFANLAPLAWFGFAVNLISGLLLFTSQATVFATNLPFLIKISCIVVGMALARVIHRRLRQQSVSSLQYMSALSDETSLRPLALLSLTIWIGAIGAGRLIAYF